MMREEIIIKKIFKKATQVIFTAQNPETCFLSIILLTNASL